MIFEETYNLLKEKCGDRIKKLVIEDIRVGLHLTAVHLSDDSYGVSATLADSYPLAPKSHRDYGDYTPLKIKGKSVTDILETTKRSNTLISIKNAVLTAVSAEFISPENYNIRDDCDPIQLANLDKGRTVVIVGAFQSYIRKIAENGNRLFVLELDESALNADQKQYYVPAAGYRKIFQISDLAIITGQTLVNGTIDELLGSIPSGTQVIVTGPSGSILPDILFRYNVSILGAIRITKPGVLFDVVGEGGSGYHLFEYCAKKISIVKSHGSGIK
jgi:uncharacterized protein (DUF4213/DUF364 family)